MRIDIEIRFTGLCAFGPEQMKDGKKFRSIMLVNARDDAEPGNSTKQPHVAAILVPYADLMGTGRDYDLRFDGTQAEFGHKDMVGFLLKGEQLSLPGLKGVDVSLEPGPKADAECPKVADRYGFGWVSSLKRTESTDPNDDALTGKNKKLLLARLRIENGVLATDKFVEYGGKIMKWIDLSSADPKKERALAEVVKLTGIYVEASPLVIYSEPFMGTPVEIHLKGKAGKARIWFVNMPLEDIVSRDRTPNARPKADFHFHHHYHLAKSRGSMRNPKPGDGVCNPVASASDKGQEGKISSAAQVARVSEPGAAASNPKCPPTSFEA